MHLPSVNGNYLAYSNNGAQFHPYGPDDVFDASRVGNPSWSDFKDPYVTTCDNGRKLVAYVAGGGGDSIYVLTSTNGVNWMPQLKDSMYVGGIPAFNGRIAETPSIQLLNGQSIMFFGTQSPSNKSIETVGYITGYFDSNGIFHMNKNGKHGTIDHGFDNYAGNFTPIDSNHLVYIGWLGNWQYFHGTHICGFTLPRIIEWNGNDINSIPIDPGTLVNKKINTLNTGSSIQYQDKDKVILEFNKPANKFNINLFRGNNININIKFNNGSLFLSCNDDFSRYMTTSKLINISNKKLSGIQLYLDNSSVEICIPEIKKIYTIIDYDNDNNAPYKLVSSKPIYITSFNFDLNQPQLNNINNITSKYSMDKANLNKDMSVLSSHVSESVNNSKTLLNDYFNDIQNAINGANNNIAQVNNYNGDARQHVFIALANNDMDIANTKLYQANIQLKNLDNLAMPYLDASAADAQIANYYKNSIANSVSSANHSKANSAASSSDNSIESSIASSFAKSANNSIASSYSNSVAKSVSSINQSKANSAANSTDASIKNSIASSEAAKNASHQSPTPAPSIPTMPTNNIIPTNPVNPMPSEPNSASNTSDIINSNNDVSPSLSNSSSLANYTNHKVNYHKYNPKIPLIGIAKHAYFYGYRNKRSAFTSIMKKHVDVLQATVKPNHKVTYKVRIGKRTGYLYGYLRKLSKLTFMNKRYNYIHIGKRTIKLPSKRFNRIEVNCAVRYAGKNYVKYYVNYRHKHGVIYGALPKISKINTNKNVYKKYYQVIPKRYHYVNVIKPLTVYDNKHFTRHTHRGSIRKGITIRVKQLIKNGGITRFKLMNGRYITGLKKYVKLIK